MISINMATSLFIPNSRLRMNCHCTLATGKSKPRTCTQSGACNITFFGGKGTTSQYGHRSYKSIISTWVKATKWKHTTWTERRTYNVNSLLFSEQQLICRKTEDEKTAYQNFTSCDRIVGINAEFLHT